MITEVRFSTEFPYVNDVPKFRQDPKFRDPAGRPAGFVGFRECGPGTALEDKRSVTKPVTGGNSLPPGEAPRVPVGHA
jgi:hypothetical protein